jgi:hypothetical protein
VGRTAARDQPILPHHTNQRMTRRKRARSQTRIAGMAGAGNMAQTTMMILPLLPRGRRGLRAAHRDSLELIWRWWSIRCTRRQRGCRPRCFPSTAPTSRRRVTCFPLWRRFWALSPPRLLRNSQMKWSRTVDTHQSRRLTRKVSPLGEGDAHFQPAVPLYPGLRDGARLGHLGV